MVYLIVSVDMCCTYTWGDNTTINKSQVNLEPIKTVMNIQT